MKNKKTSFILTLIMLAALAGGLYLVRQSQEMRRGAYFAGTDIKMVPDVVSGSVGGMITTKIYIETKNLSGSEEKAKLSALDTHVCYGSNLDMADPSTQVTLKAGVLKDVMAEKEIVDGKNCIRIIASAGGLVDPMTPEELSSGTLFEVFTLRFNAVSAGQGKIEILGDKTLIGGYNPVPDARDSALEVGIVGNSDYVISETIVDGESPVLNYKMAFGGVDPSGYQCLVSWPLQIIVLSQGESKVYTDVPSSSTIVGDKLVFSGQLSLTGFTKTENVAVFIKGPKHLQMKYGINNQVGAYNQPGGELTLTKDANSPVYDFSQYPLLAGDIVSNENESMQDGWINGVDFSP
jgi:hypothetical protein